MREERDSVEAIGRVLVSAAGGEQIPLEQLAEIRYVKGPQVIKSEDTFLTSYVLFDKEPGLSEVDVVSEARAFLSAKIESGELELPPAADARFFDPETEEELLVNAADVRAEYRDAVQEALKEWERSLRTQGVDYQIVHTDQPLSVALRGYLRKRERLG